MWKLILLLLSTLAMGSPTPELLTLQEYNTVSIIGPISDRTASRVNTELMRVKDTEVNIFIRSPGGSVIAGNNIIQLMDALALSGKSITCIAQEAYSMAFIILQACPNRYIMPNSIIMQHQMFVFAWGQLERVRSRMSLYESLEFDLNERQATRVNMTTAEFADRVAEDWWIHGKSILDNNAADKMTYVLCENNYIKKCPLLA